MLNWILAFASAALLVLAFPKWDLPWLAAVALTPLLIALARELRPWRRFLLGWFAGFVYWFGVCYWIQFDLAAYAGVGAAGGWALFTLFAVTKALHLAVFALFAGILLRRWWAVPAVSALWVAIEATHGFLGFAWLTLGNAGIDMGIPLRLAPYTGVYGVSFLFAMMSTALALTALRRPRAHLAWLGLMLFLALLPPLPDARRGHQTAVLVQPNLSETEEWTAVSLDATLRALIDLTERSVQLQPHPPAIVVWPETPAPFYYDEDPRFRHDADELARTTGAYFLTGVVAHAPNGAPLNSAELVSPSGGAVSRYDKVNLVPFGEFVPWPFAAITRKISTEAGDFAAGRQVVVSPVGQHRIGTFICYESVFPNFVRRFANQGAEVMFNLSNDGWFGKSAARWQHLEIVRMRAAENRRWILRSTNDGITAAIDSAGRLRGSVPFYQQATSLTGFDYESSKTFYTAWGDWFAILSGAIALAGLAAAALVKRPML